MDAYKKKSLLSSKNNCIVERLHQVQFHLNTGKSSVLSERLQKLTACCRDKLNELSQLNMNLLTCVRFIGDCTVCYNCSHQPLVGWSGRLNALCRCALYPSADCYMYTTRQRPCTLINKLTHYHNCTCVHV